VEAYILGVDGAKKARRGVRRARGPMRSGYCVPAGLVGVGMVFVTLFMIALLPCDCTEPPET